MTFCVVFLTHIIQDSLMFSSTISIIQIKNGGKHGNRTHAGFTRTCLANMRYEPTLAYFPKWVDIENRTQSISRSRFPATGTDLSTHVKNDWRQGLDPSSCSYAGSDPRDLSGTHQSKMVASTGFEPVICQRF